jgi:predicted nucleic acid-binding protein
MFLLDTNVVSELRGPRRRHPNVLRWAETIPQEQFYLSVVCLTELETGVMLMERRDPRQGASLRSWFEGTVLPNFVGRILPVDVAVVRCCARLQVPDPVAANDAFIAATAIVHRMTIATRNISDFARSGAALFNPWAYDPA